MLANPRHWWTLFAMAGALTMDGYFLGSSVTFIGLLLAIVLVAKKKQGADAEAGMPAAIASIETSSSA